MKTSIEKAFFALPYKIAREIRSLSLAQKRGVLAFSELYLAVGDTSALYSFKERIPLLCHVSQDELEETLKRLCRGSLYAHRDTIVEGFISIEGGIRVGVCGHARYENGRIVGVSDVRSLLFRFPIAHSSLTDELYSAWCESKSGLLIYSPPGVGKTTALRSLVSKIANRGRGERVSVIDERCEFSTDECERDGVCLYRGYKKAEGMMMAIRCMSPTAIAIDEIGCVSETEAISECSRCGVRVIATVHASDYGDLLKKADLAPLFRVGAFDTFARIFYTDAGLSLEITRL